MSRRGSDGEDKHGRKLVGDITAKSHLNRIKITASQFVDDVAIYATSREAFEVPLTVVCQVCLQVGVDC